ncbi:hypothetical protein [Liquorilactobacillus hordei]|uniref:hypothetical protein n=1 Tax=Liquorilactobacillus hordei TaxID=468911 RepID=UPI0039E89B32
MNENKDELFCGHTLRKSYFEGLTKAKEEFEKKYYKELTTIMEDLNFNLKKGNRGISYHENSRDKEIYDFLIERKDLFNLFYGNIVEVVLLSTVDQVCVKYVPRKNVEEEVRNNLN